MPPGSSGNVSLGRSCLSRDRLSVPLPHVAGGRLEDRVLQAMGQSTEVSETLYPVLPE